ncbi:hypothetical protein LOD99_15318 [Oopsacas minuta]|uniref:Calpain catalytic domain-containing protein n=1 Tax=Oopsacas minuta TaxID=111878 RepID=A0AAV7KBF4_9METZ|nr:hypothetical protein LOD99_15318 [Oopsacas minuta]
MDPQEQYKSLQQWQCYFCKNFNTLFEKYCSDCNTPIGTSCPVIDQPIQVPNDKKFAPSFSNPFFHGSSTDSPLPYNPAFNPSPEDQNSFIVIDRASETVEPVFAVPEGFVPRKETLDGPSICIPIHSAPTAYLGEDKLFESILHNPVPYGDDDTDLPPPPRPSNPTRHLEDSIDYQSEYDYSFMERQQIEQLQSIQAFITSSMVSKPEPPPDHQDSEEFRFSLTASAKEEARQIFYPPTDQIYDPQIPAAMYRSLDSSTQREENWLKELSEPYSVNPIPIPANLFPDDPPVPSPRKIKTTPIPAPRRAPQSSLAPSLPPSEPPKTGPPSPSKTKSVLQTDKIIVTTSQEEIKLDEIIAFLKEQKVNFIDPSFFPSPRSLFINPKTQDKDKLRKITWLRPGDIRTKSCRKAKWTVFNHPNPADVYQGGLGNCWFLSALSVVAEKEKLIDNLIITKEFNPQGIYQICLCMCGKWEIVTIDDSFPCRSDYRTQLYSEAVRNQLWVCLIEKAAAKLYGCYEALNSGTLLEGLSTLTGAPCEVISLIEMLRGKRVDPKEAKDVIWSQILHFESSQFLMGVSTGNREISEDIYTAVGLSQYHAYSVLSVCDMEGNRLLCLRDPNGTTRWKGDWSNKSPKWTKEMRKHLIPGGQEGIFWISLDDICNYFTSIDVCKVKLDYIEARESAVFPPFLECHSPVYIVELFDSTELDISLYQPNKRFRENSDVANWPTDISVIIFKTNEDVDETEGSCAPSPSKLAGFIERKKQACVNQSFKLEAGVYIIVPQAYSHWKTEHIIPYTIATFSSKAHILQSRPSRPGFYAEALCILARDYGRELSTSTAEVKQYRLREHFLGDLLVVENHSNNHYNIQIDGRRCYNVVATRGSTSTRDCIPPKHKQVINILTYDNTTLPINIQYTFHSSLDQNNTAGEYGVISFPELTNKNRELHSPIYI